MATIDSILVSPPCLQYIRLYIVSILEFVDHIVRILPRERLKAITTDELEALASNNLGWCGTLLNREANNLERNNCSTTLVSEVEKGG